jgi:hypothetical protein
LTKNSANANDIIVLKSKFDSQSDVNPVLFKTGTNCAFITFERVISKVNDVTNLNS